MKAGSMEGNRMSKFLSKNRELFQPPIQNFVSRSDFPVNSILGMMLTRGL